MTKEKPFFSHSQKNWLIGLLACLAVFSLLLNFISYQPKKTGDFSFIKKPNANSASADSWNDNMVQFCNRLNAAIDHADETDNEQAWFAYQDMYIDWGCGYVVGVPIENSYWDVLY